MMDKYPDELTCDMVETYGVFDIKRLPAKLAAMLAVGLREDSRVKRAKSKTPYDDKTILLAEIADMLLWLKWSRTEDGVNGRNYPGTPAHDYYYGKAEEPRAEKQSDHVVYDSPEDFMEKRYGKRS